MRKIKLTQGKIALVDDEDYERVNQYKWYASSYPYAQRKKDKSTQSMHRFILELSDPKISVDHINHNGLDNRRENMRICSQSENLRNRNKSENLSSKYKGVYFSRHAQKFKAQIQWKKNKKHISKYLGYFDSEESAAIAYNVAAKKYFGEFAKLNEI